MECDDRRRPRAAARATTPTRSREAVDFLAWLLRGNFVLLGAREYEISDGAYRGHPGLRPGHPGRRGATRPTPSRCPLETLPRALRELALEGELLIVDKANARVAGAPPRADGLRRRPPRHARRRDRRRGAPARPVHHQGLRRAGVRDAGAAPQAAARARGRGPDRGLARLQGGGRAVRHASPRTSCSPRRSTTCAARSSRCSALEGTDRVRAARPPRAGRAQRVVHRSRCRATRYDAALRRARPRAVPRSASSTGDVDAQHVLGEGDARARALPRPPARTGCPSIDNARARGARSLELARTWDDALRDALVERYGEPRARAGRAWAPHLPEHYKGYTAPVTGGLRHRAARAAGRRRRPVPRRRCSRCAGNTRVAPVQARRRRSSWAARCRCSRTSGCA